jgi:hypothetical protein
MSIYRHAAAKLHAATFAKPIVRARTEEVFQGSRPDYFSVLKTMLGDLLSTVRREAMRCKTLKAK